MNVTSEHHGTYQLASMAGVSAPDTHTSPGALFLDGVETGAREAWEWADDPRELDDAVHEVADGAVPVYTHERWQVFVDLAAYSEDLTAYSEDLTELGGYDGADMTSGAGVALYLIASRLTSALFEEWTEEHDADA